MGYIKLGEWGTRVGVYGDEGLLDVEPGWCEALKVMLYRLRRAVVFSTRSNVCSENLRLLCFIFYVLSSSAVYVK